jgi:hypothetical protein
MIGRLFIGETIKPLRAETKNRQLRLPVFMCGEFLFDEVRLGGRPNLLGGLFGC